MASRNSISLSGHDMQLGSVPDWWFLGDNDNPERLPLEELVGVHHLDLDVENERFHGLHGIKL